MRPRQEVHARRTGGDAAKWRSYLRVSVKVHVQFRPRRQADATFELPDGATVGALLALVKESPDSTLVVRGDTPIPESESIRDGEELLLMSSFSGG